MMKRIIFAVAGALATAGVLAAETADAKSKHEHHPHWSYAGKTGAKHWGGLEPDFTTCKIGKQQSPVDIRGSGKGELPPMGFNYTNSPAEVVNNGHSIQVNMASGGSVKLASGEYKLVQFHFHAPSEERIKAKAFPMDAHFVHRDEEGKLAVIAVLFKTSKKDNHALAKIFDVMPTSPESKTEIKDGVDPTDLLPATQDYYSYVGSLTTPPCSEGVQWQVLKTPVSVSRAQLKAFQKLYPMNARPVQPMNGRSVQEG